MARDPWPLYVRIDLSDLRVFTSEGELTPEFLRLIQS